jgi:hypothetical protein
MFVFQLNTSISRKALDEEEIGASKKPNYVIFPIGYEISKHYIPIEY